MSTAKTTGLGEPEITGKKSLFRPPEPPQPIQQPTNTAKRIIPKEEPKKPEKPAARLRMTIDLTKPAWETIQSLQHRYRLQTGKVLPAWKIISEALEQYDKKRKDETTKAH